MKSEKLIIVVLCLFLAIFNAAAVTVRPSSVVIPIRTGFDDGDESCTLDLGKNEAYLGKNDLTCSGIPFVTGLRFLDVPIKRNAEIISAYIEFTADGPYSNTIGLNIYGDAAANSLPLTNGLNRQTTVSKVSWAIGQKWTWNTIKKTPDISNIIRELTSKPDWEYNNDLTVLIKQSSGTTHRRIFAYERDRSKVAKLVINYRNP